MLCQECSLKSECREDCAALEKYVRSRSNFRTTSSSKDVTPSAIPEKVSKLCQTCRVKGICREECAALEEYVKSKCNFKTTYSVKEVSLSAFPEGASMMWSSTNETFTPGHFLKPSYARLIPKVGVLIDTLVLTDRQREVIGLYYKGGSSVAEISRCLGLSHQAVTQTIFGHATQGGGVVRKIRKAVATDEHLKNYL